MSQSKVNFIPTTDLVIAVSKKKGKKKLGK